MNAQGDVTRVSTRNSKDVVMKGTLCQYFRLGQEGKYRVYHNQYSSNTVALNKHQHREARSMTACVCHLNIHKSSIVFARGSPIIIDTQKSEMIRSWQWKMTITGVFCLFTRTTTRGDISPTSSAWHQQESLSGTGLFMARRCWPSPHWDSPSSSWRTMSLHRSCTLTGPHTGTP